MLRNKDLASKRTHTATKAHSDNMAAQYHIQNPSMDNPSDLLLKLQGKISLSSDQGSH